MRWPIISQQVQPTAWAIKIGLSTVDIVLYPRVRELLTRLGEGKNVNHDRAERWIREAILYRRTYLASWVRPQSDYVRIRNKKLRWYLPFSGLSDDAVTYAVYTDISSSQVCTALI